MENPRCERVAVLQGETRPFFCGKFAVVCSCSRVLLATWPLFSGLQEARDVRKLVSTREVQNPQYIRRTFLVNGG